ncbi:hypothetical protein VFPFJ_08591 [Purpureocillium lilacinum]|uniref:Uncharacterized protein n=1 Tax=Purpureocillium lilacinum TaxID=33203 RepID=A0A179GB99_PURLI|nr:hypothetical protein VFPFJ_08591 [Purpureocillium lilacinum]OAQ74681.1 hypothetical protein VFPBJ_09976 [Purpureocillium lilacinum]OAQ82788.1 hypothetical protein VFPFJ_08591 [Purpureocillium lilacinum]
MLAYVNNSTRVVRGASRLSTSSPPRPATLCAALIPACSAAAATVLAVPQPTGLIAVALAILLAPDPVPIPVVVRRPVPLPVGASLLPAVSLGALLEEVRLLPWPGLQWPCKTQKVHCT